MGENVNELYDIWKDLKEVKMPQETSHRTENKKDKTVNM